MNNKTSDKNVAKDSVIAHKFAVMQQQLEQKDKRIQELEEETTKLKAHHVFTRNEATDEEKAELYDVIDKTLDTFLEKEKPIWQQEMIKDKMSLEEALSIVDEMYQNKYKIIEKNNTIYVDKLNDIKFTSLEFASVRLLREVQRLQYKLENSIPKQKIKDLLTEIQEEYNKLDKEIDKQIKDKNKDYYKCKENIAIMQTLAYCRDKFEGLLEEK